MMEACRSVGISIEHHGQRVVLRLHGELDVANRHVLRRELNAILDQDPPTLEVDLSGLGFADCSSLSILASAQIRLAEHGHELIITGAQPVVRRLLAVTGLDAFFRLSEPAAQDSEPAGGWGTAMLSCPPAATGEQDPPGEVISPS
jgi:anti-anti-sigma factor